MPLDVLEQGAQVVRAFRADRDLPGASRPNNDLTAVAAAAHWVSRRAAGLEFWTWARSRAGESCLLAAAPPSSDPAFRIILVAAHTQGLTLAGAPQTTQRVEDAAELVLAHKAPYQVLLAEGQGSIYCLGLKRTEGLLVFDPQIGELVFPLVGNFRSFLPRAFASHAGTDAGSALFHLERCRLLGFLPPA